jgi:hypothetical protein
MDVEKLVEEVARAMCADLGVHADDWSEEEGVRTYAWQKEASTARSAILATLRGVREASEGMREAYKDAEDDYNDHPCEFYINTERYTAMIDHLIKAVEG